MQSLQHILVRARRFASLGLAILLGAALLYLWIRAFKAHERGLEFSLYALLAVLILAVATVAIGRTLGAFISRRFRAKKHESILAFKNHRYLKVAGLLSAAAIALYIWEDTATVAHLRAELLRVTPEWIKQDIEPAVSGDRVAGIRSYGNTFVGLTLGWVAAILVLWLMLLGIRKRRFASVAGSVQGQTSAHVYLGVTLLLIGALHSGFEFGWNLHTLVYVLMSIVIVSGMYGVFAYLWYPRDLTANLGKDSAESLLARIDALQLQAERTAMNLPIEIVRIVEGARKTRIGGGFRRRLAGNSIRCPTQKAFDRLDQWRRRSAPLPEERSKDFDALRVAMAEKVTVIRRLRNDIRMRALLEVWLYVHIPFSFALLAALIAHIIIVFYYNN